MGYEVEFAGTKLHNYFNVLKINRSILPPRTNFTKEIPSIHGQMYTGYKYEPKKYTLECAITSTDREDFMDKIQQIAFVLDTKEPKKLILGDEPHIYHYAVLDGNTDLEKVYKTGRFNIDFIAYDPIGYAIEEDEFYGDTKKITTVQNNGTTDAYPKVSVEFSKDAFFLQCTNYTGETVLVGVPPSVDKPQASFDPQILRDNCETLNGWTNSANVLDKDREVDGNLVVNGGGWGICLANRATSSNRKWVGGAMRKNLSSNVEDFKIEVKMQHNSKGDVKGTGATTSPPTTTPSGGVKYKVTADPTLRVRSGRGTSFSQIGSYKKGIIVSVSDIQKNWGKVSYSGKTGYIHMDYVVKYTEPSPTPSSKYKVNTSTGLNVRSGRGTKYSKLTTMPHGYTTTVTDISNGWGKVTYSGKTGYCSMQYMTKVNATRNIEGKSDFVPSAENRIGLIELYGFDNENNKLFKVSMKDSEEWYEYSEPFVEFGSTTVLEDGKKCPAPKQVNQKDDEGKDVIKDGVVQKKTIDGGKVGDWNEFDGWFTIQRKTVNGKQQWVATVEKLGSNNKVERKLQTQNLVGNYPKGKLNHVILYIAGYADKENVDVMSMSELYVTDIGTPPKPQEIKPLFRKGDEVVIDNSKQKVYKNGKLFLSETDIGSQFFSSPTGESQFVCQSDDTGIDVISTIQTKWL